MLACLAALSALVIGSPRRDRVHGQAPAPAEAVIVVLRVDAAPRAFDASQPARLGNEERNAWRGARDRVRLRDNERRAATPRARVVSVIRALGGTVTRHFHALPSLAARIPAGTIDRLRAHPDVDRVTPDRARYPRLSIAVPSILTSAFTTAGFTGTSVDVAVVDTGVFSLNTLIDPPGPSSRLVNRISLASGCAAPDDDTSADDYQGHGTAIAGVIASVDAMYAGVAPGVRKLVNVKAACATISGITQQDSDVIGGVEMALTLGDDAPEVINYSFGTIAFADAPFPDPYDNEALSRYLDAVADVHFKVITVPAGNNFDIDTPGIAYNTLTVGATDPHGTIERANDTVLLDSARGPTVVSGRKKPDVVAPGAPVVSPSYLGNTGLTSDIPGMGTSLSSAFVAGLAALILDAGVGDATVLEPDKAIAAKALIINSADDIDPFTAGWSPSSGWGYVNGSTAFAQRSSVVALDVTGAGTGATYFHRPATTSAKATLVWTRDVTTSTSNPVASPLKNLDLRLYSAATGALLADSVVDRRQRRAGAGQHQHSHGAAGRQRLRWFPTCSAGPLRRVHEERPAVACSLAGDTADRRPPVAVHRHGHADQHVAGGRTAGAAARLDNGDAGSPARRRIRHRWKRRAGGRPDRTRRVGAGAVVRDRTGGAGRAGTHRQHRQRRLRHLDQRVGIGECGRVGVVHVRAHAADRARRRERRDHRHRGDDGRRMSMDAGQQRPMADGAGPSTHGIRHVDRDPPGQHH